MHITGPRSAALAARIDAARKRKQNAISKSRRKQRPQPLVTTVQPAVPVAVVVDNNDGRGGEAAPRSLAVESPLVKPPLPTAPPYLDLRHVADAEQRARLERAYKVETAEYEERLREYRKVLYPAYRSEQKRRAARSAYQQRRHEQIAQAPSLTRPQPEPVTVVPSIQPELLDIVRRMYQHFGWLRLEKLLGELDKRPLSSNPWQALLPEDMLRYKDMRGHTHSQIFRRSMKDAFRYVKRECKAAGLPVPDRKNEVEPSKRMR